MMEIYWESRVTARKEHTCAMCGRKIIPGETYFREKGKWDGDFFSRALHAPCHLLEVDYCSEVDTEFTWSDITDYAQEAYCDTCEHSPRFEDDEDWTDCNERATTCPRILNALKEKFKYAED